MYLLENEPTIRISIFLGLLVLMIIWQIFFPRRQNNTRIMMKTHRWGSHTLIVVISTLLVRLLLPLSAVAFAAYIDNNALALLPFNLHSVFGIIIGIVLLDLLIYWQHRIFHEVPLLWRLHKVHHSDKYFDATTALRFHPIEILLSMLIKFTAIWVFGFSAITVILFEIILNSTAIFNHSNARIPADSILRLFIVTPDMHRVHHSVYKEETNSNYGFNIPLWDRLFKSYNAQPKDGHEAMEIGLFEYPKGEQTLKGLLLMPFQSVPTPEKPPESK